MIIKNNKKYVFITMYILKFLIFFLYRKKFIYKMINIDLSIYNIYISKKIQNNENRILYIYINGLKNKTDHNRKK